MKGVIVGNFGVKDGVQTYRINGSYEDLQDIILECIDADASFDEFPEIERLRLNHCTLLLKLKVKVEVKPNWS